jgi:uncharacterized membrane protein
MGLGQYRVAALVLVLGLALIAVSSLLASVVNFTDSSEEFSEFWLLGPEHTTEGYPFNVSAGETYNLFVCLKNHMGSSENYRIYVKFGNSTQFHFDHSKPLSLPPLYEFQTIVDDESLWESPVTFGFQNLAIEDNVVTVDNATTTISVLSVGDITINGETFPVDASTSWDSENNGFYFRLSFELWRYNATLNDYRFDNRLVGLRLNMTTPQ